MTAIHIQGLGTYVPTKRITNVDLMSLVDTNDEWIVSRTGIKARHMLADDENGSDAGTEAALKSLEDAGKRSFEKGVQPLGGLVQQQNRRLAQQDFSQSQPLLLPAGEVIRVRVHQGLKLHFFRDPSHAGRPLFL